MRRLLALLLFGACLAAFAQSRMTVEQLVAFIRSSIQLKQEDREVAKYLGKVKLTQRLEERIIEELQGMGAGYQTVTALRTLAEASKGLPAPSTAVIAEPPRVTIPPPSAEEQRRVIAAAREYALSYIRNLPDFLCTQVTRRFADPTGLEFWQKLDTITTRLSYAENKEDYKVILVNSRPVDTTLDAVGGAVSTGEFGSLMKELFEDKTEADFNWERWTTLRGRRAHVYNYRVAQARSQWHVTYQRSMDIVPAYHGLVYIDRDTNSVLRVTLNAELPPAFPIQQAGTVLDYDWADIAGVRHLLPLKAVVRMREGKFLMRNDVEFRMYRKFATETSISFEEPEPLPEEKTQEQPPK